MGEPPAAGRRQRFAWCLFDFANSSYNTVVVTFLWVTFFAEALVGDKALGNRYWGTMLVITGVVVAIASPLITSMVPPVAFSRALWSGELEGPPEYPGIQGVGMSAWLGVEERPA